MGFAGTHPSSAELPAASPSARRRPELEFRSVFEAHRAAVMSSLRRLGVPSADQKDVCQEVFVAIHRKLKTFDGSVPLAVWVQGICERVAARYRRVVRVRKEKACEPPALDAIKFVPANQDRAVDTRRACAHAEALLKSLDHEKRRVFVLYELEGLNMNEVADELGCPLQTGYSRLHAARKIIRMLLVRERLRPRRAN